METTDKDYPQVKNLDGSSFTVHRNGRTVNRCFTDLTMEEQDAVLDTLNTEGLKTMCKSFGNALRWLCDMFNIEGIGDDEEEAETIK